MATTLSGKTVLPTMGCTNAPGGTDIAFRSTGGGLWGTVPARVVPGWRRWGRGEAVWAVSRWGAFGKEV